MDIIDMETVLLMTLGFMRKTFDEEGTCDARCARSFFLCLSIG